MYGAILGDIIGSPYEFDRGNKTTDFPLFIRQSEYTDDSIMTIAVAEALMKAGENCTIQEIKCFIIETMQKWGRKYPYAGYGGSFKNWLAVDEPRPYGSYGNGSAMRVSAVGWMYDSIERTREVARASAEITHNHPEGVKGAESVASAIYLARTGKSKAEIKKYIMENFYYDFSRSLDDIRPTYHHVESCQETVPEAFTAFFEGNSFENVIRLAVSLGGDSDTLTCIAGSIAEAFYGIPDALIKECEDRLPKDLLQVVKDFSLFRKKSDHQSYDSTFENNDVIESAIEMFHKDTNEDNLVKILESIRSGINKNAEIIIPVEVPQAAVDMLNFDTLKPGDMVTSKEDLRFKMRYLEMKDGRQWLVAFTSQKETNKGESTSIIINSMEYFLKAVLEMEDIAGVAINPWDRLFLLDKELIQIIMDANK